RAKASRSIVGEPIFDVSVDRDPVVVIERDQLRQPQGSCEAARLVTQAFHEATVAQEYVRVMVDDRVARTVEASREQLLRERHADRVREALAERARRRLDARRHTGCGVPGCLRMQVPEAQQLYDRQ